jgi:hypothetical protein
MWYHRESTVSVRLGATIGAPHGVLSGKFLIYARNRRAIPLTQPRHGWGKVMFPNGAIDPQHDFRRESLEASQINR